MAFSEVHLAGEAVAALVDGELSRSAFHRAIGHMVRCAECRQAVLSQREAKDLLVGADLPAVPGDLLGRLNDVPMTTDLGGGAGPGGGGGGGGGFGAGSQLTLAVVDGELVWGTLPAEPPDLPVPAGRRGRRNTRPRVRGNRPDTYPINQVRTQRLRRGLAGTLAGLAFGVLAAASPTATSGVGGPERSGAGGTGGQVVPARAGLTGDTLRTGTRQSTSRSVRTSPARTSSVQVEQVGVTGHRYAVQPR
jgi:hypothetical protein